MRPRRGTVDAHLPDHRAHCIRFGLHVSEKVVPQTLASPAIEPIRARLPCTEALGQIAPWRPGAHLPQDPPDDGAVIPPLTATSSTCRQEWLNARPRPIRQLASTYHLASPRLACAATRVAHHRIFVRQDLDSATRAVWGRATCSTGLSRPWRARPPWVASGPRRLRAHVSTGTGWPLLRRFARASHRGAASAPFS
jgi:hypothetical protein